MRLHRSILSLIFGALAVSSGLAQNMETLVPEESRISDEDARLQVARLLSYRKRTLQQSLQQYRRLVSEDSSDSMIRYEMAEVLYQLGQKKAAISELRRVHAARPGETRVALKLADLEAEQGHAAEANALYRRYAGESPRDIAVGLRYGQAMRAWGDFDKAETLYLRYLAKNPGNLAIRLELAEMLASAQRYEEAEGMYRLMLRKNPRNLAARHGLARVKLLEKDFVQASALAAETMATSPGHREAAKLKNAAEEELAKGNQAPLSPEERSAFFKNKQEKLERKLHQDPGLYGERLELAEILAAQEHYEASLEQLDLLQTQFPQTFKVLLTKARVLSWSKQYKESIELYEELSALNPNNPVPIKEMARVASWAKERRRSHEYYSRLFSDPVDTQLTGLAIEEGEKPYLEYERNLTRGRLELEGRASALPRGGAIQRQCGSPALQRRIVSEQPSRVRLPSSAQSDAMLRLLPDYRIQKTMFLEDKAKGLAWDKRFLRTEDTLQELVAFQPGNQEALFDLAQAQCAQGLGQRKVETYRQLLALDPFHTRAQRALHMHEMRSRPGGQLDYWHSREDGRGGLSDLARHIFRGSAEFRIAEQYYARAGENFWLELPGETETTYEAHGPTLEAGGVFNEYLSGALSFTYKDYFQPSIEDTYTGSAGLTFNAWDYTRLNFLYERVDELHNRFGFRQGVQSDNYSLGFVSMVTRQFEIAGRATYRHYTDDNDGQIVTLQPAYSFTEHPHIFKVTLLGEYRDTTEDSIFVYDKGNLRNIIHPYWTPQNYWKGALTLEWYHDLAHEFFCGAEQHFYNLKVNLGTDTERNPGIGVEGEWLFEFQERWAIHVQAGLFRSFEWNGETARASLRYRF